MGQFSLAIHGLRPCSLQSRFRSLRGAQANSVIPRALWGNKKAGLVESKTSISNPISRSPRPLPQSSPAGPQLARGRARGPVPPPLLPWAGAGGGRAGNPPNRVSSLSTAPPGPHPAPAASWVASCCGLGVEGGRWRGTFGHLFSSERHPLAAGGTPTPSASSWGSRPQFWGPGKGPPRAGHSKTPESRGEADDSALAGLWAQYHHQPPGYPFPVSSCVSTFLPPPLCSLATRRSEFSHVLFLTAKESEAEEAQTPARGHTGRKQQRLASPAPSPVCTITRLSDLLPGVVHGAQTMG